MLFFLLSLIQGLNVLLIFFVSFNLCLFFPLDLRLLTMHLFTRSASVRHSRDRLLPTRLSEIWFLSLDFLAVGCGSVWSACLLTSVSLVQFGNMNIHCGSPRDVERGERRRKIRTDLSFILRVECLV